MIIFKIIFIFFLSFIFKANASEITIVELHTKKSLDQLVLETTSNEDQNNEISNNNDNNADNLNENKKIEEKNNNNEENEIQNDEDFNNTSNSNEKEQSIIILDTESVFQFSDDELIYFIKSIKNIKSKTLNEEFIKILSNIDLDDQNFTENKLILIIQKLFEIGEIERAYNLVKKINMSKIKKQENVELINLIKLNYLYSTYKIPEVCELKSLLTEISIKLPNNLLEKSDIFCLTLENKFPEAELQNSLLLESEKENDENFQRLFKYMISDNRKTLNFEPLKNVKHKELIFLYSAMLRINELPLNETFIDVDPLNLSIPVILSKSTAMNVRLKAANKAYYEDDISINSLSALYQSVDFNSNQFDNPELTISSLKNDELIMAFYYQLANIQIFPNDRLNVILEYWDYAISVELQKIAYALTENIIENFPVSSENSQFANKIAYSYISNAKYDQAIKWLDLFTKTDQNDEKFDYANFLINLNKNDNLDTIIEFITNNYRKIHNNENQYLVESIEVLNNFLEIETNYEQKFFYENLLDNRLMPSYFLLKDIKYNIEKNNNLSLLMLSLISLENKNWKEIHPEHLSLILETFKLYNQGDLIKKIILEILDEFNLFYE